MDFLTHTFNKVANVCKDIGNGLDFRSGYGPNRLWKGINDVWTGYNAVQLAFTVAAVGAGGLLSVPALFTGLGLAIAYGYGRREFH